VKRSDSIRIVHTPSPVPRKFSTSSGHDLVVFGVHSYAPGFDVFWESEPCTMRVGSYVSIASDVKVMLGQEHHVEWATTYPFQVHPAEWPELRHLSGHPATRGDIIVGNDVWIGHGAQLRSGISIGDGAVIGMGAIVTRDVPPYAVVAGVPARVMRFRFPQPTVDWLLRLQWWNLSPVVVRRLAPLLCQPLDSAQQLRIERELVALGVRVSASFPTDAT